MKSKIKVLLKSLKKKKEESSSLDKEDALINEIAEQIKQGTYVFTNAPNGMTLYFYAFCKVHNIKTYRPPYNKDVNKK